MQEKARAGPSSPMCRKEKDVRQGQGQGQPGQELWLPVVHALGGEMNEFEDSEEYQLFGLSSDISIKQPKQIVMNPKASKAPCPQTLHETHDSCQQE